MTKKATGILLLLGAAILISGLDLSGISISKKGFVIEIQPGFPAGELPESDSPAKAVFHLKIDLLKITPIELVQLKSNTIRVDDGVPVEYKFGYQPDRNGEIIPFTIHILPTVMAADDLKIRFKITLYQGAEKLKDETVVIRDRESVIVELLENRQSRSKISFRVTPLSKSPGDPEFWQFDRSLSIEEQIIRESFKYDVKVDVMLVPVFAVDADDKPVFDLKKEELELYIDGKAGKIIQLRPYEFEEDQGVIDLRGKVRDLILKKPERVIFIIVDLVFNNWSGIKRAKQIACNLVASASPGDRFVVLEFNAHRGLKYIIGPEADRKKLIDHINGIKQLTSQRLQKLYSQLGIKDTDVSEGFGMIGPIADKLQYKSYIQRFSYELGQFKYALRTIIKPKIVFLISRGMARGAYDNVTGVRPAQRGVDFDTFLFSFFRKIARAVNEGGSILYTVNSERLKDSIDEVESGELTLLTLARSSGGKYFSGSNPIDITQKIKKTTAAYYELVFSPGENGEKKRQIDIRCKRSGVTINSIKYSEIQRPYNKMNELQRKLFALNVVQEGDWSRMVADIQKAKYKKSETRKMAGKRSIAIELDLPEIMRNKELDIFTIRYDPKNHEPGIKMKRRKAESKLQMQLMKYDQHDLYFAIIEPEDTFCIYNAVR